MTINSSGSISLAGSTTGQSIALELGQSATSQISLNDTLVRALASKTTAGSTVNMPADFYSKTYLPTWNTASGSIGSGYTQQGVSFTVNASNASSYALVGGSLPSGLSLNTSNGVISGTISAGTVSDFSSGTFNFTIRANAIGSVDRAFSIFVQSRYVGYSCSTAGENGTCSDTAPGSYIFNRVDFSSYGTPNGGCGGFSYGGCNSGSSNGYNPTPCKSYSVGATNGNWGDPCGGTAKRMYIQMSYGPF